MSQKLIAFTVSQDQLAAIDTAMDSLENELKGLVALSVATRRAASKMGQKSEAFCRQTLSALKLYPNIVPPSVDIATAEVDLATLDQLRPRFQRLYNLAKRADDSELALGSDAMTTALQGYGHLKVAGKSQGLEYLRKELGTRFASKRNAAEEPPAPAAS